MPSLNVKDFENKLLKLGRRMHIAPHHSDKGHTFWGDGNTTMQSDSRNMYSNNTVNIHGDGGGVWWKYM